MTWFVVVGRMHGDYEATATAVASDTKDGAAEEFQVQLRSWHSFAGPVPDDGPGAVYIDSIFDCGQHRPREVL